MVVPEGDQIVQLLRSRPQQASLGIPQAIVSVIESSKRCWWSVGHTSCVPRSTDHRTCGFDRLSKAYRYGASVSYRRRVQLYLCHFREFVKLHVLFHALSDPFIVGHLSHSLQSGLSLESVIYDVVHISLDLFFRLLEFGTYSPIMLGMYYK